MTDWGPWIEHDGNGCPVPLGTILNVITEHRRGQYREGVVMVERRDLPAFDWSNWQSRSSHKMLWSRVIRYRIRKPRGMQVLEGILRDTNAPVRELVQ